MDMRTAFKFGFLLRCAEAGCTAEEIDALVEKSAGWAETLWNVPGHLAGWGLVGLGAAGLVGASAGLAKAHLDEGTLDPEEVRKRELIAAYNTHAQEMRNHQLARRRREQPGQVSVRL